MEPCFCELGAIMCKDNSTIDLEEIFRRLSLRLYANEKHFEAFYLDNTLNEELTENTFKDITFDEIHISNQNYLKVIHENAFINTEAITKKVILDNNPALSSNGNSLFHILSKFINAEQILLRYLNVEEIPSNAFRAVSSYQDQLKSLSIIGPSFKRLGERSFSSLKRLERLTIWDTALKWIPEHAFEFEGYHSSQPLVIWFNTNPFIKSSSFHRNSLYNINRPAHIEFAYGEHGLDYFDEKIFLNFLRKNSRNTVDLGYKQFDCNGCRHYWLKKNPELIQQVLNFRCSNGRELLDSRNFARCK